MLGIPELTTAINKLRGQLITSTASGTQNATIVVKALESLGLQIDLLTKEIVELRQIFDVPPDPLGPLLITLTKEIDKMLIYDVTLPKLPASDPAAKDTVRGELRLAYDGVDQPVIETTPDQETVSDVRIEQGVQVTGSFQFVDDAGNVSKNPTRLTAFTTSDTVPPPDAVGDLGFVAKGEE